MGADMQRSAEALLKTYLGERTGERVLAGRTKRGEGEKIHAVIWLCDLRDSTRRYTRLSGCATCEIRPGFPNRCRWRISFAP
jgi:adenylate cyclase